MLTLGMLVQAFYRGFVPGILRAFPTVRSLSPSCSALPRPGLTLASHCSQNASALFVWEGVMRLMGAEKIVEKND